jgi:NADH-quinone oxidoreductase subunit N
MSVLIIVFLTAVVALFSGVFEQGKFARYIGILGLIIALYVSFMPECSFFDSTNICMTTPPILRYSQKYQS